MEMFDNVRAMVADPLVAFVLGVAGIALTYLLYRRSLPKTRVLHTFEEVSLVSKARQNYFGDKLEISYDGVKVPVVTLSKYTVWNAGTSVLNSSDIAPIDPLRIGLTDDGYILKVDKVASRPVNMVDVQISLDRKFADISFDFLDPQEGFVCEVIHTGERMQSALIGTVKGAPKSPEYVMDAPQFEVTFMRGKAGINIIASFGLVFVFLGLLLLSATVIPGVQQILQYEPEFLRKTSEALNQPWVYSVFGMMLLVPGIFIVWQARKSPRQPEGLRKLKFNRS